MVSGSPHFTVETDMFCLMQQLGYIPLLPVTVDDNDYND